MEQALAVLTAQVEQLQGVQSRNALLQASVPAIRLRRPTAALPCIICRLDSNLSLQGVSIDAFFRDFRGNLREMEVDFFLGLRRKT